MTPWPLMKMKRSKPWAVTLSDDVDQVVDDVIPLDGDDTREVHVVGVEGEGHDRQDQQLVRGAPAGGVAEPGDDEVVGVQRQVVAVLLGGADRLNDDRFARRRLPQLVPGQIAPVERGAIGEFHLPSPFHSSADHTDLLPTIASISTRRATLARRLAGLCAVRSVLRQPVGAVQPLTLLIAEGEGAAVDLDLPDAPRHQPPAERAVGDGGVVPGAHDLDPGAHRHRSSAPASPATHASPRQRLLFRRRVAARSAAVAASSTTRSSSRLDDDDAVVVLRGVERDPAVADVCSTCSGSRRNGSP